MINFLKQILTWWHKQTLGTFIYTLFTGKLVGIDEFGNKYYSNSKGKRWVIYKNDIEASKIPPEWHSWIHFLVINKPTDKSKKFVSIVVKGLYPLEKEVTLHEIKKNKDFKDFSLVRQSRLSVMKVDLKYWKKICKMGKVPN